MNDNNGHGNGNGNPARRTVRFQKPEDSSIGKKRGRVERPNQDELDDIDDWTPADDDNNDEGVVPSLAANQLLQAKRQRRLLRQQQGNDPNKHGDDNDTALFLNDNDDDDQYNERDKSLAAEGIAVEPFHMNRENSDGTGFFDGDTYVFRKRMDDEEPDAWLEGLNETNPDQDSKNDDSSTSEQDEENQALSTNNKMDGWTEHELYAAILPLVSDTETVMQAIVRYGNIIKQNRIRKSSQPQQQKVPPPPAVQMAQDSLNQITEASSALLLKGQVDIYQKTRNDLMSMLPSNEQLTDHHQNGLGAANNSSNSVLVQWEYQGSQDGQIHGPYSTKEMVEWIQAGYFVGSTAVMVRSITTSATPMANNNPTNHNNNDKAQLQQDLLDDLMDEDDDDEDDKKLPNGKQQQEAVVTRGEWVLSDQVDFKEY